MAKRAQVFCKLHYLDDLSVLSGMHETEWLSIALRPSYNTFSVPKKDGSLRWIEDPNPPTKKGQRFLQNYLQAVYHFLRTPAAYGFLVNALDEPAPRHLLSHAQQHIGNRWLLNLDLTSFFYQVSAEEVFRIFSQKPFDMSFDLADLLTKICTHKGRLPMGSPTSPIISNFATIQLDEALLNYSFNHTITYTRYADDLTFSSEKEITTPIVTDLKQIIIEQGFVPNEDKTKLSSPNEERIVTGLIVTENEVRLPPDFVPKLKKEIERLNHLNEVQTIMNRRDSVWAKEYEDAVRGKLSFMSMVRGKNDVAYRQLQGMFQDALTPPDDFEAVSWLYFNYNTALIE